MTGVRRCGKSYLLFHLFHDHLLDSGVAEDHYIILDEVQYLDEFEDV